MRVGLGELPTGGFVIPLGCGMMATDAAGDLDVLARTLWLAHDGHESETRNVETNFNHGSGKAQVHRMCIGVFQFEICQNLPDIFT